MVSLAVCYLESGETRRWQSRLRIRCLETSRLVAGALRLRRLAYCVDSKTMPIFGARSG